MFHSVGEKRLRFCYMRVSKIDDDYSGIDLFLSRAIIIKEELEVNI